MECSLELFAHQKTSLEVKRNNIYEEFLIKILSGVTRHNIYELLLKRQTACPSSRFVNFALRVSQTIRHSFGLYQIPSSLLLTVCTEARPARHSLLWYHDTVFLRTLSPTPHDGFLFLQDIVETLFVFIKKSSDSHKWWVYFYLVDTALALMVLKQLLFIPSKVRDQLNVLCGLAPCTGLLLCNPRSDSPLELIYKHIVIGGGGGCKECCCWVFNKRAGSAGPMSDKQTSSIALREALRSWS